MANKQRNAAPIAENEYVRELLSILRNNQLPQQNDVLAVLKQVAAMEQQLAAAVRELTAMRRDLAAAERNNHPVKTALQKAVINMQAHVLELREKLAALKQAVIDGCKKAVAAFKEKGIAALGNIARFFKVRVVLWEVHKSANQSAQSAERAAATLEEAGFRYHEAGRHLKNVGRALSGKDAVADARPNGKLVKAITAPFRAAHACFSRIDERAAATVEHLDRLEQRGRKPPVRETMKKYQDKISREEREKPARKKARPAPEL